MHPQRTKKNSIARKKCRTVWEKQGLSGVGSKSRYWGRRGGAEPVQTVCRLGRRCGGTAAVCSVGIACRSGNNPCDLRRRNMARGNRISAASMPWT
jgi:hypothetical protein